MQTFKMGVSFPPFPVTLTVFQLTGVVNGKFKG